MTIWSSEIKDLTSLYENFKGRLPELEKELNQLTKSDDPNVLMLYSRRCLEVIITDLCECELKRPRKTEPLKGIIDKLHKEEKVPSHIITSMHGLNELSTYGAHPKDFDPAQVKPVLNNLDIIIKWYLKYKEFGSDIKVTPAEEITHEIKNTGNVKKDITISRKRLAGILGGSIGIIASVFAVLYFSNIIGDSRQIKELDKSIAVLPFDNLSGDPDQEYFSDGMMDEILDRLFKIGDLKVISRTSSMRYKNSDLSLKEIAGELDVAAILEGSVRRAGNLVRITVQLIDTETDSHLWSETYDGDLSDLTRIFIIQSEVAQSVARELKAVISPQEIKLIEKKPAIDIDVYDEYLKARSYWSDFTKESLFKSVEYLNSAIEKNPDWAPLYAGLAEVWIWVQQAGWEQPSVAGPIIMENLNKAMELDPDLAEVHYQSAVIAQLVEWDWEKSEKEFLKSLAINPNNPLARLMYAQLLLILNRPDESLAQRELAISLDPLNFNTRLLYIGTLVLAGECKASISLMEEALANNPEDLNINGMLEMAAYKCKDYDKVIKAVKVLLPFYAIEEATYEKIRRIYNESGIVSAYEELMKHMEKYAEKNYIGFSDMAFRYKIANQPDKAMDWIEKGFESHDPLMTYMFISRSEPLFGNPRFIAICEKMNLPIPKSN